MEWDVSRLTVIRSHAEIVFVVTTRSSSLSLSTSFQCRLWQFHVSAYFHLPQRRIVLLASMLEILQVLKQLYEDHLQFVFHLLAKVDDYDIDHSTEANTWAHIFG